MFTIIGAIISEALGGVKDHFKGKRELKAAEQKNVARLLTNEQSHNNAWEMANLQDKDKWLRRISFIMFTFPFIWIYFDPAGAQEYFIILDEYLPDWYKKTYMAMTGGIWGISALKNAVPNLISGVVNSIRKN